MDGVHIPDLPDAHEVTHSLPLRVEAECKCLHEQHALFRRVISALCRLLRIQSEGFFAENVLSRIRGLPDPFEVEVIGQGDVDSLDVPVREHLVVGAVGSLDPQIVRRRFRFRG